MKNSTSISCLPYIRTLPMWYRLLDLDSWFWSSALPFKNQLRKQVGMNKIYRQGKERMYGQIRTVKDISRLVELFFRMEMTCFDKESSSIWKQLVYIPLFLSLKRYNLGNHLMLGNLLIRPISGHFPPSRSSLCEHVKELGYRNVFRQTTSGAPLFLTS